MPTWELTPISPRSVAVALPARVVGNDELCRDLDTTPEWIEEKTGIRERRFVADDEDILTLACTAATRALEGAELRPEDVDVLVVATESPDWLLPSFGVTMASELGITTPRIIDITQHACAASIYATYTAACLMQEPGLQNALVVCADTPSRATDPDDRTTRIFFGDAAGAVVYRRAERSEGLLSYDLGNNYSPAVALPSTTLMGHQAATGRPVESRYLRMDGARVLREARAVMPRTVGRTLEDAGLDSSEISGFALHQPNARLLRRINAVMGVDDGRVPLTADTLGNTAAVAPLTSLWRLAADGLAKRGNNIVLGAIGAGFMWGSFCFRLADDLEARGEW